MALNFNVDPYYDDFDGAKNFHRILFKPGVAVQARELTQSQTILQNQITSFADNIFKQNSPVTGGQVTTNFDVKYIKIQPEYNGITIDVETFQDKLIRNADGTVVARVLKTAVATGTAGEGDSATLIVSYKTGTEFTDNDVIYDADSNLTCQAMPSGAVGSSSIASISQGVFYVLGNFVQVTPQTVILDKYGNVPSRRVGLEITETIYDYANDNSLLDPAVGASNYQAPGADRYVISLQLSSRPLYFGDDALFIELVRVEEGSVYRMVDGSVYATIDDYFAKRDYETNGDYIIQDFKLTPKSYDNDVNKYAMNVGKGLAYVHGYRVENPSPINIISNRARTTASQNNEPSFVDYGSYFLVNNISGTGTYTFPVTTANTVDFHCVANSDINTANSTTYNSTLVATAYIRGLQFDNSPINSDPSSYVFKAHVYDIENKSISANVISANATSITLASINGKSSSVDGAYVGVDVTIVKGTNAGETRTISNYNGTTRAAAVSQAWSVTPDSTSVYVLNFDTPDIESMVFTSSSYPKTVYASAEIDSSGKAGNIPAGDTEFFNPNTPEMIYPIGNPYVSSISSPAYTTYQEFTGVNFDVAGSKLSASLDYTSSYADVIKHLGNEGTTLSNDVVEQCFTVIVTDRKSSSLTNGQVVPWTINGRSVSLNNNGSVAELSTTTSDLSAFTATVIAKVFVVDGTNTSHILRIKNLVTGNTTSVSSNANNYMTQVATNTFVDDSTNSKGHIYIKADGVLPTGSKQSLYLSDVKKIRKIIDTKTDTYPTAAMLTNSTYDVTSRYIFDNGQRDSYYDHGSISLRPGAAKPTGNLFIIVDYYKHAGGDGYFSKMSYIDNSSSPENYNEIPSYTSKHGVVYALRDCIDFRPARLNAQTQFVFRCTNQAGRTGLLQPANLSTFICDYSYYLGRKDKLVITKDKSIQMIEGSPSINPLLPNEPDGALVLANITHKPYTGYVPTEITTGLSDLSIESVQHRRYTMSDIAGLDTRINRIEYYTALNALEQNANSLQISDAYGLNRFKNGIMVDDFSGYSAADAGVKDFSASINRRTKRMTAKQTVKNFPLKNLALAYNMERPTSEAISNLNFARTSDGFTNYFMLPYTTTNIVAQKLASRTVNLNPFSVTNSKGLISLSPNVDNWVDTSFSPSLLIVDPNLHIWQSSNVVNTLVSGDWQTVSGTTTLDAQSSKAATWNTRWIGNTLETVTETTTTSTYKTVTKQTGTDILGAYSKLDNTYSLNNGYINDISILPWLRPQEIVVRGQGMLYKTLIYSFFDTVSVDNYIRKTNVIELTDVAGTFKQNDIVGYYKNGTFTPTGIVIGVYDYPNSNSMRLYVAGDVATTTYNDGMSLINSFYNADGVFQGYDATGTFSSQTHNSGMVQSVVNSTSFTLSDLASSVNTDYIGSTIYITASPYGNEGQSAVITGYNGTTKVITVATPITTYDGDIYSIGSFVTDEEGSFYGIFTVPKNTFHTGTRVLRLDNRFNGNESTITTFAEGTFYAQGLQINKQNIDFGASPAGAKDTFLQSKNRDVVTYKTTVNVVDVYTYTRHDPVAQTFIIDKNNFANGAYITSVKVFFATKPTSDSAPVRLSIIGTLNGYPNGTTLDNSIVTLPAYKIKTSASPQYLDDTSYTEFVFDSPVYIQSDTLYAILLQSSSNEYTVYTAANGDTALPSSVKNLVTDPYPSSITKISTAPYVGALFLSQNAQTWSADQNQSLMFTIERAKFDTTKTPSIRMVVPKKMPQRTIVENQISYFKDANTIIDTVGTISNEDLLVDAFNLTTTDFVPSGTAITYTYSAKLQSNVYTNEVSVNPGRYGTTMYDHIHLNDNKGERIIEANSTTSFSMYGYLESTDDAVTPVISDAATSLFTIQYTINNCELSNSLISITDGGSGYNAQTTSVTVSAPTGKNSEQAYAVANVVNGVIDAIYITTPGAGYIETPTITIADANSTPGTGATATVSGETSVKGGPAETRYITKKVVLEGGFDSGDLNVYLSAYRPVGTDVNVYYKVLSRNDTQAFDDGYWQIMTKTKSCDGIYSQSREDLHEYTFAPGASGVDQGFISYLSTNGQTYYTFSQFAIKIVMTTTDKTLVPFLSDMRCIALPPNTNTTF